MIPCPGLLISGHIDPALRWTVEHVDPCELYHAKGKLTGTTYARCTCGHSSVVWRAVPRDVVGWGEIIAGVLHRRASRGYVNVSVALDTPWLVAWETWQERLRCADGCDLDWVSPHVEPHDGIVMLMELPDSQGRFRAKYQIRRLEELGTCNWDHTTSWLEEAHAIIEAGNHAALVATKDGELICKLERP